MIIDTTMAPLVPEFSLNNGRKILAVGMGSWLGRPVGNSGNDDDTKLQAEVRKMCKDAIAAGYRHFDTADAYGNEEQVGLAIKESGIPREEFFVTTKLHNGNHDKVKKAFEASLNALDIGYIDLYLVHWPQASKGNFMSESLQPEEFPTIQDTWKAMEELYSERPDQLKSIGVSNFSIKTLTTLLENSSVVPAVNQVELHPCLPQEQLKKFCDEKNIHLTAYSPLGQQDMTLHEAPAIKAIADKHEVANSQIILSWAVERGISVVPKSSNPERMRSNITLVNLSEDEMKALNNFHKGDGMHKSLLGYHSEGDSVFGWTYEQLGWNLKFDPTSKKGLYHDSGH